MRHLSGVMAGFFTVLLAACAPEAAQCTLIGADSGIAVEVAADLASRADEAEIVLCQNNHCSTQKIPLYVSTDANSEQCTGDSCSAHSTETGEKHGFASVAELSETDAEVQVALIDANGTAIFHNTYRKAPEQIFPNGTECGAEGVQLSLRIES